MTEEQGQAPGDVEPDQRGTKQYCANFNSSGDTSAMAFREALRMLGGHDRQSELALLAGKVRDHATIRHWKNGTRALPPWAIAVVRAKAERLTDLVGMMKAGPGSKAGRRNLRRGNWPR